MKVLVPRVATIIIIYGVHSYVSFYYTLQVLQIYQISFVCSYLYLMLIVSGGAPD